MNANKLITKILKESNVDAKITKDMDAPKFRVVNNNLTLEGIYKNNKYAMKIKDFKGEVIDQLSVNITNGNDLVNRINESINTLNNLSPIYDKQLKLKEDEEFEELPQAEPGDINGALKSLQEVYDILMNLAEKVDGITDYFEDDEAEDKNQIISYVATLYDLAMDISEYRTDKIEEMHEGDDEDVNESVKVCKTAKSSCMNALNNITVAEAMLRGHKEFKDVQQVLKNVRTELELRK